MLELFEQIETVEIERYRRGAVVFRRGDRITHMRVVQRGRIIVHVAVAGQLLAEASLFSSEYHCDAEALSDIRVASYPKAEVRAFMEADPRRSLELTRYLSEQVRDLRARLELRNIRSARDRLKAYLQLHMEEGSSRFVVEGTLLQLAAELGLAHETLYRCLAAMERDGELRRQGDAITLM